MTDPGTTLQSAIALLEAVDAGQVTVHYQALYSLPALEVVGFEALVRWQHPSRGLLAPGAFLPEDMDGGLGWTLTNFVLEEAVRDCADWQRRGVAAGVSVNISPGRFVDDVLADHLDELLTRHRLDPRWLTVEVTESRCSADPPGMRRALNSLSRRGIRISLDDFGTGDSTLARLKHLHFDEIKIDRCFIGGIADDPTDRHIVAFAVGLAHSLGMKVVAEGIETGAALCAVAKLGVDLVQGFHLHRPEPVGPGSPWAT
jgi:diguanylate cyclase